MALALRTSPDYNADEVYMSEPVSVISAVEMYYESPVLGCASFIEDVTLFSGAVDTDAGVIGGGFGEG